MQAVEAHEQAHARVVVGGLETLAKAEAAAHGAMAAGIAGAAAALPAPLWDPAALLRTFALSGPGEPIPGAAARVVWVVGTLSINGALHLILISAHGRGQRPRDARGSKRAE